MPMKVTMVHYIYDILLTGPSEADIAYTLNVSGRDMHARGLITKSGNMEGTATTTSS